jgi:hypothetical protein
VAYTLNRLFSNTGGIVRINSVTSLSSASHTAIDAIRNVTREAQQVAHNVNTAVTNEAGEPVSKIASERALLPVLKNRLAANVRVVNSIENLYDELGSLLLKR